MRCLVLSDIHANLAALEAVLEHARHHHARFDAVWCLGDVVGYGPDPNECVERIRGLTASGEPNICLLGNHDWAVLDERITEAFNDIAAFAVRWTRQALTAENLDYLRTLSPTAQHGDYSLAHASLREPIWEYILTAAIAAENFALMRTTRALVGHTHVPAVFVWDTSAQRARAFALSPGMTLRLNPAHRFILNPGSVGQPRDGDPRAAYTVLDIEAGLWTQYRVEYPIARTQEKMRAQDFPLILVERLAHGY
ncbi:MAG: metallophosphoesterase family protein [Anaerolineae bacterium]|nr:metallophosphatase family protein [Thermoflexales bacterium]MDW8396161.1 metallophosphoesterase family protein [Anaerolineae bacterium]